MWTDERYPDTSFICGVDIAQGGADWTAISVLKRTEPVDGSPTEYAAMWLQRWRDRRTARVPETLLKIWRQIEKTAREEHFQRHGTTIGGDPDIRLCVDITGVGPFATDPIRKVGLDPISIQIHGGDAVSHPEPHIWRVPKRDLAGAVNILLESGRLKIANALPDAATLKAELENFRAKITLTGHDTYAAGGGEEWREGAHDDLVLSVAIAAWLGEWQPSPKLDPVLASAFADLPG